MDYVRLAVRTENKDFEGIKGRLTNDMIRLLHGAMGIGTEVGEIFDSEDSSNLKEELGDVCWYIALCCDSMGIRLEDLEQDPTFEPYTELEIMDLGLDYLLMKQKMASRAGMGLDYVKKHVFYGKPLDTPGMKMVIGEVVSFVRSLCTYSKIDYEDMKAKKKGGGGGFFSQDDTAILPYKLPRSTLSLPRARSSCPPIGAAPTDSGARVTARKIIRPRPTSRAR